MVDHAERVSAEVFARKLPEEPPEDIRKRTNTQKNPRKTSGRGANTRKDLQKTSGRKANTIHCLAILRTAKTSATPRTPLRNPFRLGECSPFLSGVASNLRASAAVTTFERIVLLTRPQ
eukprot:g2172.t1